MAYRYNFFGVALENPFSRLFVQILNTVLLIRDIV